MGDRLLAVDVFALAEGFETLVGMPVIRSRDDDGIDVVASAQFPVVGVGLAILVAVVGVDGRFSGIASVRVVVFPLPIAVVEAIDITDGCLA